MTIFAISNYLLKNNLLTISDCINAIIAVVGLLMAFVSIFLSYQGIRATHNVHKEIGMEKYKTKQQEVVAELISQLNKFNVILDFRVYGTDTNEYVTYQFANIVGLLEVNETLEKNHVGFLKSKVFFDESFQFDFINELADNAYMPIPIAKQLRMINRRFWEETNIPLNGRCVTIQKYGDPIPANYRLANAEVFCNWSKFVNQVDKLIKCINAWYKEEYNTDGPNLYPCVELIGSDRLMLSEKRGMI